jgi:anti-sigma B factor antagonist
MRSVSSPAGECASWRTCHSDVVLTITVTADEPCVVVVVDGEVDISNAHELRARLSEAIDGGSGDVVIDCERLTFVDSSGLGAILAAWTALLRRDRALRLRNVRGAVARAVRESGLDTVLELEPDD